MPQERDEAAASVSTLETDAAGSSEGATARRSLVEDVEDLLVDARNWLDAELTYQKTRASFIAGSIRNGVAFAALAALAGFLALIGLTVGLILALAPLISAWGATAVVCLALFGLCAILLKLSLDRWRDISAAIREDKDPD